jgi:hypothetical protein
MNLKVESNLTQSNTTLFMTCDISHLITNLKYITTLLYDHYYMLTLTPSLNGHMEKQSFVPEYKLVWTKHVKDVSSA